MGRGIGRCSPALVLASIALFVALGGTVYAAKKIDGKTIRAKSIPGNRLALGSLPGNRLKPGAIPSSALAPGSVNGTHIDVNTLGTVPTAIHADTADSARDAATALHAVSALTATRVNGHSAGCAPTTRFFAGACWQTASNEAAVTATAAALSCATQGGELPAALPLAAFAQQPGIALAAGDEWTGDITNASGPDAYAVITISPAGQLNFVIPTLSRKYRCVIPLVT
jgi:hypothetical protein